MKWRMPLTFEEWRIVEPELGPRAFGVLARRRACVAWCAELVLLLCCLILAAGWGYTVTASYYGDGDWYDLTASGEVFDPNDWSAAHPLAGTAQMPFGTKIKVCGPVACARGVRVNDVGPASWTGRGLDVSEPVAVKIGLIAPGHAPVTYYATGGYTDKWMWD